MITSSAISSCKNSTRSAEQRWPADWKPEEITSSTTCSGNAVESTIIQFWPPVSAINGTWSPPRSAKVCEISVPVCVEPVNMTVWMRSSGIITLPTSLPRAITACTTPSGNPTDFIKSMVRKAIKLVCSAGFANTVLPVAIAAATWPKNIARGKFHGLMHKITPRASKRSSAAISTAFSA